MTDFTEIKCEICDCGFELTIRDKLFEIGDSTMVMTCPKCKKEWTIEIASFSFPKQDGP